MCRVYFGALLAATVLSSGSASPQQVQAAAQTFTIGGTAVEHGSNRPLKDVTVSITHVEQPENSLSYRTGEDGRFLFTQLPAGKYRLGARKRGFPPQVFANVCWRVGAQSHDRRIALSCRRRL